MSETIMWEVTLISVMVLPLISCASCPTHRTIIPNGNLILNKTDGSVPNGTKALVNCNPGYSNEKTLQRHFYIYCGSHGWTREDGSMKLPMCTSTRCPYPPEVPKAFLKAPYKQSMYEGTVVEYVCERGSYLLESRSATLTCKNGEWDGPIPTCVEKANCNIPAKITNGEWYPIMNDGKDFDNSNSYAKICSIGSEIQYYCKPRYKLVGPEVLQCMADMSWSRSPPICIPENEKVWYCDGIDQIKNGYCKCVGQKKADLKLCMPFVRDTRIECHCLSEYVLQGNGILTCIQGSSMNLGEWNFQLPKCDKKYQEDDMDRLMDGQIGTDDKGYNSGNISDDKNKVSSLVIVITTACSVLGVLGLIMVIVIFRKKKPRAPHIFQQGPAAPPYARVHNSSMDEHDRLALMAYAEASRAHLPSYEEAMRGECVTRSGHGGSGNRSISPTSLEYQRLPTLQYRGVAHSQPPPFGGDGNNNINNNNNNNNTNRHSTVTTSTMNRDGVSEISGSIDTVNVSMSDASTSVTVETFDSGTSNRSMASQRATAGSLTSSEDHLATDDAPLLETNSQRDADVVSVTSNPSRTSKED